LIDNVVSDFREPINIGFAGTKIAALNRVVEQAVNAIAIVLIILCRINAALRGNRVGAPRRILKTKTFHPVSEFTEGRRGRSAGEAAADDYDLKLSPVVGADQSRMVLMVSPFLIQRPWRNFRIQCSNHASGICLE
jgi:hypothetical protein